ncbi:hypothetical protein XENORESO_016855 [Xenotaenia resolanae]|uniref:Secreted protein n=1 Tax=Xenotaenia resolanae TaxID=208358 RepID=A0ABV0W683_9TELE
MCPSCLLLLLLPSCLSLFASPAFQRTVRKVRRIASRIFLLPPFKASCLISFPPSVSSFSFVCLNPKQHPLFFTPVLYHTFFSPLPSIFTSPFHLTLLFLHAFLAGDFQTLGACQEPPGMAPLSAPFPPIRSDAWTQSSGSSQQQLQEEQLAAGQLVDLQTFNCASHVDISSVCCCLL